MEQINYVLQKVIDTIADLKSVSGNLAKQVI